MAKKKAPKRKSNMELVKTQLQKVNNGVKDNKFTFSGPMTIVDFAEKTGESTLDIVKNFFLSGKMYNANHILNEEEVAELCVERKLDFEIIEEVNATNFLDVLQFDDQEEDLARRAPILTIMGHVDHGKTTLIDAIRQSKITSSEASGITQQIGAYQIEHQGKKITFLDTPGHEAFTAMRARGSQLTDIVILVVAADDGIMPQTREAIQHAKNADVPIIVFVNKMDKHEKDLERLKSELTTNDVIIEEWGGDVPIIYGSALNNQGISDLFDVINLQTEIMDLKANPNRLPTGVIVESRMAKGEGPVSTLIVKQGTLRTGDFIVAGSCFGRIKKMIDSNYKVIKEAKPGLPARVSGLNYAASAGEKFIGFEDEKFAKKLAAENELITKREKFVQQTQSMTIETSDNVINLIIKTSSEGTSEALKHALENLSIDEVEIKVVATGIGDLSNADILLAQASESEVVTFDVKVNNKFLNDLKEKGILLHEFNVIYAVIEHFQNRLEEASSPKYTFEKRGRSQILKIFTYSKVGNIAGCVQEEGFIRDDSLVKLYRDEKLLFEGEVDTLQKGPDPVKQVTAGFEFGMHLKDFDAIEEGDFVESWEKVLIK